MIEQEKYSFENPSDIEGIIVLVIVLQVKSSKYTYLLNPYKYRSQKLKVKVAGKEVYKVEA